MSFVSYTFTGKFSCPKPANSGSYHNGQGPQPSTPATCSSAQAVSDSVMQYGGMK